METISAREEINKLCKKYPINQYVLYAFAIGEIKIEQLRVDPTIPM